MANDPFQNLPPIDNTEPAPKQSPFQAETSDHASPAEVAASAPQRNLLKTAGKIAIPIGGLAIFAWIFLSPDQPHGTVKVETVKVDVDTTSQANDTASLVKGLKSDSEKPRPAPVVVPVMPGSPAPTAAYPAGAIGTVASGPNSTGAGQVQGGTAHPRAPMPPTAPLPGRYTPGMAPAGSPQAMFEEQAQKTLADKIKRQEEIRSSPIEVSQVKLLPQQGGQEATHPANPVADLQAELASAARQRPDGASPQQSLQEQMLAAIMPQKEQQRSKGTSEEFLANTAAATNASSVNNAQANVLRVQAPAARYLINEGTVIRAVLLTNVKSEMPGRVLARITSDVYDSQQRHILIPKGSLINGVYSSQVAVGQERLLMAMTKLTLPNGNWIPLAGAGATDMMGTAGMGAEVDNHFFKMFSSSLIIGASTLMLPRPDTTVTSLPGNSTGGGVPTAGSIFATTLNSILGALLDRNKNIAPTLKQSAGQEFIFMAAQDMAMPPFQ